MLRWLSLAFVLGCSFEHGVHAVVDGSTTTGDSSQTTGDTMTPPPDAENCSSVPGVGVTVCLSAPPTGNTTVPSSTTIDTDVTGTGALQCKALLAGSSNVCVIAASKITINASRTLSAHGARPLVLLASTIQIDGTIDVASHVDGDTGPGANLAGCSAGSDPANNAGGGGQGGSFGTAGGDGGSVGDQSNTRGIAGNAFTPASLRGGCAGAPGGDGGGAAGDGGGAVLLVADTITFGPMGRINASGASGRGAPTGRKGGGGAGSGGMIALAATTIMVTPGTHIFANGGHGGGGSNDDDPGTSGSDPISATSVGAGGAAPDEAGDGGDAFPAVDRDGSSSSGSGGGGGAGGGGGGGGAGVIRVFSSSSLGAAQVSPPPT